MKTSIKYFLLIATIFFSTSCLRAQNSSNYASTLEVGAGYVVDGIGIMAGYDYYVNKYDYVQLSVFASMSEQVENRYRIPYQEFTVQVGYFIKLWEGEQWKKPGSLNIGGGGSIIGYEAINRGSEQLYNGAIIDGRSKFIYGAFLGLEGEYPIFSNEWALTIKLNEFFHANSDLGQFMLYAGIGVKYYLF